MRKLVIITKNYIHYNCLSDDSNKLTYIKCRTLSLIIFNNFDIISDTVHFNFFKSGCCLSQTDFELV